MAIIECKDNKLEELIKENVVLVDFYATWCGPCKMLEPVLGNVSKKVDINIIKVDTDENDELPGNYGIRTLPTMIIFKDGVEVEKIRGFVEEKEILKKIKQYL